MDLYPAIDLLGGRCVRLKYGDYRQETRYEVDPVEVAVEFAAAGAPWIHVVDLDAARGAGPVNRSIIGEIASCVDAPVQVGGGVRNDDAAEAMFSLGVQRVVIGTAAVRNPVFVERLASAGRQVAVGLDVREGEVAIEGWQEPSGRSLIEMLDRFANVGVAVAVITFIDRDGTLEGPDLEGYESALAATSLSVIASGGVGSGDDIQRLAGLSVDGKGLEGAIIGKALHDGVLSIDDAIKASACVGNMGGRP